MSSQDRMISITGVLIPKTLVSVSHSAATKYTIEISAKEEEIKKIVNQKFKESQVLIDMKH